MGGGGGSLKEILISKIFGNFETVSVEEDPDPSGSK